MTPVKRLLALSLCLALPLPASAGMKNVPALPKAAGRLTFVAAPPALTAGIKELPAFPKAAVRLTLVVAAPAQAPAKGARALPALTAAQTRIAAADAASTKEAELKALYTGAAKTERTAVAGSVSTPQPLAGASASAPRASSPPAPRAAAPKRATLKTLLAGALLAALAACGKSDRDHGPKPDYGDTVDRRPHWTQVYEPNNHPLSATAPNPAVTALELELAGRINARRAELGLAPLSLREDLSAVARAHSEHMAKDVHPFVGVVNPELDDPIVRAFKAAGLQFERHMQAVARGPLPGAVDVFDLMLASPEVQALIEDPYLTELGVGYDVDPDGKHAWTADLAEGDGFTAPAPSQWYSNPPEANADAGPVLKAFSNADFMNRLSYQTSGAAGGLASAYRSAYVPSEPQEPSGPGPQPSQPSYFAPTQPSPGSYTYYNSTTEQWEIDWSAYNSAYAAWQSEYAAWEAAWDAYDRWQADYDQWVHDHDQWEDDHRAWESSAPVVTWKQYIQPTQNALGELAAAWTNAKTLPPAQQRDATLASYWAAVSAMQDLEARFESQYGTGGPQQVHAELQRLRDLMAQLARIYDRP